ncbi:MAG: biopolymer transporter ExbD [Betaproteobacteria bacterium]|jgi:biopolymer transport protein ExbD|nr:biopolymer transporter ExbD [Betaproteobacteria bacterium]NBR95184.1 biopolymer transporter ExbD [Pseudomonadota bacterium]
MKITRARINHKPRIEIIPMVDIMFFLLATLLITTISLEKHQSLPINLTSGSAQNIATHDVLNVVIDANNQVFINQKPIKIHNIQEELKSIANSQNTSVIIFADEKAYQGIVLQTMLAINKLQFKQVSMAIDHASSQN